MRAWWHWLEVFEQFHHIYTLPSWFGGLRALKHTWATVQCAAHQRREEA